MRDEIDQYWEKEALPALMEFGTIPNVSPSYAKNWKEEGHMEHAVTYLAAWAKGRPIPGMTVEVVREEGKTPLIFIEVPGTDGSSETILMYGHYDKQPPMEGWRAGLGPWTPVREGDLVYGRGLADDGYAIFAALGGIEAAVKGGLTYPRIVVIVEGSEESGSPDLEHYIDTLASRIGNPKTVVTLDVEGQDTEHLWLTQSLRGIVNGYLTIEGLGRNMHSGLATGVVPSVSRIFRILVDRIEDAATGTIRSTVLNPPASAASCSNCDVIAQTQGTKFLENYHLPPYLRPVEEDLSALIQRNLWQAGMEVTGISGLPQVEMAGNVLAGRLKVKLSFRIPPGVDADEAYVELKKIFETDPPYGAKVSFESSDRDSGWSAKPYSEAGKAHIWKAAQEVYGTEPVVTGDGASIPFVGMFVEKYPDSEHVLIGVLSHGSNAHGPNENLNIPIVKRVTEFVARLIQRS